MYWNENNYLPTLCKQVFEDLETELDRPLRVLYGRGRTVVPGHWTPTQRERALGAPTAADAEARGITLLVYGSFNDLLALRSVEAFLNKPELWNGNQGYANGATIHDVVTPVTPLLVGDPFMIEDTLIGEIQERCVAIHLPLEWLPYVKTDNFIRDLVMLSLDEAAIAAWQTAQEARNFTAFCDLLKRGTNEGLVMVEKKIEAAMTKQSNAAEILAKTKTQLRNYGAQLAAMRAATDEDAMQQSREEAWGRLHDHPKIEAINLDGKKIMIDTVELTITHPITGDVAPLGKFRWTICPEQVTIKAQNLTNRRGNYDHPHIMNNRPCFGSMGGAIFELLARGDLAAMVEMLFVFLGTINLEDDWSRRASFWFDETLQARALADPDRDLVTA